ncbi:MAG TPA: aminotransferase class V-fold PLP-dependent enzyme [Bacteroidales bacterium]|nr:aminotransferase class V-fold PLP-dependent enzyme [Bacteroidales bacterium]
MTTRLYEDAREIVRKHLGVGRDYTVIFCTPARAETFTSRLPAGTWVEVSGREIGLRLGVTAVAARKNALPRGVPFETGGGTARLTGDGWVVWDAVPSRFEAGTPAILNVIAFARALQLLRKTGQSSFAPDTGKTMTADDILYRDNLENNTGADLLRALQEDAAGRTVRVPTRYGERPYIHLDNSASTPAFEPVVAAFFNALHQPEPVQCEIPAETRGIVSRFLDAPAENYEIIFTSNTTEAINLAAASLPKESEPGIRPVIVTTLLEHTSNDLPWRYVADYDLVRLPVDREGFFDLAGLEVLLADYNRDGKHDNQRIRFVTVSFASNVLGSYNDIGEISRIVHRAGAHLVVDAAQGVAHRKIEMERCRIDILAFSAHKVYAPFGSGALILRKGLLGLSSERMERMRISGEENTAGIAALGKSLVILQRIGMEVIRKEEEELTRRLLTGMAKIPGVRIFGLRSPDSPLFPRKGGVIAFDVKGKMPGAIARALAESGGIGVRFGCHCSHMLVKYLHKITPGLERFQSFLVRIIPGMNLPGVVRVSLGVANTAGQVDDFLAALTAIAVKDTGKDSLLPQSVVKKEIGNFVERVRRRVWDEGIDK